MAAGQQHSLALTDGGEVYSWGAAQHGRLGHGAPAARAFFGSAVEFKPRLIRAFEALRVQQIAAGQMHSAAVSASGDAYIWGYGKFYQLGTGSEDDVLSPTGALCLTAAAAPADVTGRQAEARALPPDALNPCCPSIHSQ